MCPSCVSNIAIAIASVTATSGLSMLGILKLGPRNDSRPGRAGRPAPETDQPKSEKE
jgi:hypothetical protein